MSETEFRCEKWPHFELWQGTRIPAIIVPILISTAFVAYKIYEKWNPRPAPVEPEPAEPTTEKEESKAHDEETGDSQTPHSPKKTRLEKFLWFLLYWFDIQFTVRYVLRPSSLTPDLYWIAPLSALVTLAAGIYARWPSHKSPSDDDWALAMVWILAMLKAQELLPDHWYIYILIAALGSGFLFPTPPNKPIKTELRLHYHFNWTCVLAYFVDGRIPSNSPIREYHFLSSEAWPLALLFGISLLQLAWKWTTRYLHLFGQTDTTESLRKDAKLELTGLYRGVRAIAIFAAFFVLTDFAAGTCIPWRYIVLHKPATPPSVTSSDSIIAGLIMMETLASMILWNKYWNKWSQARLTAELWYLVVSATGYAILGLLLLAAGLWRWKLTGSDRPLRCVSTLHG